MPSMPLPSSSIQTSRKPPQASWPRTGYSDKAKALSGRLALIYKGVSVKFIYEIVPVGTTPTWDAQNSHSFNVPVSVGDKVKPNTSGSDLKKVVAVEHYSNVSVLYVE